MIPFNRPSASGNEAKYVTDALREGIWAGDGPACRKAEKSLESSMSARRVLLTTSCTHALEMSGMLLDLRAGDEVVIPSFTFVSTANAYVRFGAKPVFIDVRDDTLNLDERVLEAALTPKTKAIVCVHYAGVGCEMDAILEIAGRRGVNVIEDNAHGLFGTYKRRALGTFGTFGTQSFHDTKNFSCGEGGALVVSDPAFVERAEIVREKGTNRARFFRGQVDKYTWVDIGSSYVLSDLQGALLLAQLERREQIQSARHRIWDAYAAGLASWARAREVRMPFVPEACEQTYHMYYLRFPTLDRRTAFIGHMNERGVKTAFHYHSLHTSPMGRAWGGGDAKCPVTDAASDGLVRLPMFADLSDEDVARVVDAAVSFA